MSWLWSWHDRFAFVDRAPEPGPLVKSLVRKALRAAGWEINRLSPATSPRDPIALYEQNGRVPFAMGYAEAKSLLLARALEDPSVLEVFRRGQALPPGYGVGVDERIVEYPWAYARLPAGRGRVLDAGSVLNDGFLVGHPLMREKKLHIVTLAPERGCRCVDGVSHIYEDLRRLPVSADCYDVVLCISTLEHIGLDNSSFRGTVEDAPDTYSTALTEMRRVLKPGGKLLLTVPFGRYKNFGSFQLFDKRLVDSVVATFSPSCVEETYFRYTAHGWIVSDAAACEDAEYVPWIMQPAHERLPQFPVQPDKAAAARAVACLEMIK